MSTDTHPIVRTLITTDEGTLIQTANSVSTVTAQVLKRPLKAYDTYDARGINAELLTDVITDIKANQLLWYQNAWRTTKFFDPKTMAATTAYAHYNETMAADKITVDALVAFPTSPDKPTCGTPMCCAGWTGELTGVDWVIDARIIAMFIKADRHLDDLEMQLPLVFVTKAWYEAHDTRFIGCDHWDQYWVDDLPVGVLDIILDRGFHSDTHVVITVADYAKAVLGINCDPLEMFNGDIDLDELERRAQVYLDYGADFTREQARQISWGADPASVLAGVDEEEDE